MQVPDLIRVSPYLTFSIFSKLGQIFSSQERKRPDMLALFDALIKSVIHDCKAQWEVCMM